MSETCSTKLLTDNHRAAGLLSTDNERFLCAGKQAQTKESFVNIFINKNICSVPGADAGAVAERGPGSAQGRDARRVPYSVPQRVP